MIAEVLLGVERDRRRERGGREELRVIASEGLFKLSKEGYEDKGKGIVEM